MEIGKTNKDESVELSLSRVQKSALVQIPLKRNNIYNTVITVLTPFGKSTQILPKVEENLGLFWQKVKEEEEKKNKQKKHVFQIPSLKLTGHAVPRSL